jgi:hypothetical protein
MYLLFLGDYFECVYAQTQRWNQRKWVTKVVFEEALKNMSEHYVIWEIKTGLKSNSSCSVI